MALIQNNAAEKTSFLEFSIAAPVRTDSGADFEQVMQTTKENTASPQEQTAQEPGNVSEKSDARDIMKEKLAAVNSKAQNKISASETEVDPQTVLEAVGALIADIRELLTEVFQVSEEELSGLMAEMEITDMDLLNPQVIDKLAVELTGAEDAMELLFQPEFVDTLKSLKQEVGVLKEEAFSMLNLSEKEVQEIVKEELPVIREEITEEKRSEYSAKPEIPVEKPAETAVVSDKKETADSGAEEKSSQNTPQFTAADPVMTGIEQAVEEALPEVDAENVVRQLVERIQVSVTEDTSSFEMQLNPEHLGRINLQVAAKNGVVTAQIAAENETVKEALESQIIVLKESLNNQGIKVEAVEVTVASHGFERNLDEQRDQEQKQGREGSRRFRFDVMEAAEEELTPADAVVRDMMLANGNQINYMA